MIGIYKITSPSGKVYIGQGIDLERRFKEHKNLNTTKKHPRLYNSFVKYGIDSHSFEVILECNAEELNKHERHYQELYNVIDKNGLNCLLTKEGDKSGSISEYTRLKMREANKGRNHSEETKLKISNTTKGKVVLEKTKIKISESKKGKKRSDDLKNKLRVANLGKKQSEETKLKKSESRKKIILNTQTGVFYIGLNEASIAIDIKKRTLGTYLRGYKKNKTNLIYV